MPEPIIYEEDFYSLESMTIVEQLEVFCEQQMDFNESLITTHRELFALITRQNTIIDELEKRVYVLEEIQDILRDVQ